ncbi:protein FAM8A1 [Anastrepha obliqua]|uniref:protein FAM8A1 n=1 Tax=Anastrepha obliqua TaxID=95512 RepID=UPI002409CD5D|nr:protein FAM8A1 [Anastrepha obliqua]
MSVVNKLKDGKDVNSEPEDAASKHLLGATQQLDAEKEKHVPTESATEKGNERELTTKEAYFASLNEWVKHANISQNAMALFPWYLINSYPQIFQNQQGIPYGGLGSAIPPVNAQMPGSGVGNLNAADANGLGGRGRVIFQYRIMSDQMQAELIQRTGGYEYVIAPFWKRVVAEIIDMLILLVLKIVITFTIMNLFDLDLGFDIDKEVLRKALEDDDYASFLGVSMDFLAFSSDLLMLELLTKIIVCFYEAIWTAAYNGATPGKAAMNLSIQYVEAVYPLQPPVDVQAQLPPLARRFQGFQAQRVPVTALLFPAEVPTFQRAFLRAVSKNLIMTLFFPMCFIIIFFKNNRTAYDIVTKTIVVESNPNPVLRRPPPQQ